MYNQRNTGGLRRWRHCSPAWPFFSAKVWGVRQIVKNVSCNKNDARARTGRRGVASPALGWPRLPPCATRSTFQTEGPLCAIAFIFGGGGPRSFHSGVCRAWLDVGSSVDAAAVACVPFALIIRRNNPPYSCRSYFARALSYFLLPASTLLSLDSPRFRRDSQGCPLPFPFFSLCLYGANERCYSRDSQGERAIRYSRLRSGRSLSEFSGDGVCRISQMCPRGRPCTIA